MKPAQSGSSEEGNVDYVAADYLPALIARTDQDE
jgi:hypothetical protein